MNKKKKFIYTFLFILILLGLILFLSLRGCTLQQQQGQSDFEPIYLDVELTVNPEKAEVNEPIVFEAKATYGEENVEDANEVSFEIWRANDEEHEDIIVEHAEKGIYRLEKSFKREGTYYVVSHVTARDYHNMPRKEFVVGQPSEPEEDPSSTVMDEDA